MNAQPYYRRDDRWLALIVRQPHCRSFQRPISWYHPIGSAVLVHQLEAEGQARIEGYGRAARYVYIGG